MLAIIYLALAVWIGDLIGRRFYPYASAPHRLAAAFIVGLLTSTWLTYLVARTFAGTSRPLIWGNLVFFGVAVVAFALTRRRVTPENNQEPSGENAGREIIEIKANYDLPESQVRSLKSDRFDWLLVGAYFVIACWLMFATLNSTGGKLQIGNNQFSDFGPNTAIMQSFAVGNNFPTEYPHFAGDRIRYHFLFYFQAGNLEFLGLDPAWSLNLLSILSLVAMLTLVMVLGEALFNSRTVGRLGSALFFFFGSLSFVPYLKKQGSLSTAIHAIVNQRDFLPSIFPYRGEEWGVWSLVVFLNQRHLAFAIAALLLVLAFLVARYRDALEQKPKRVTEISNSDDAPAQEANITAVNNEHSEAPVDSERKLPAPESRPFFSEVYPFVFSGLMLGLLPMWNSAVFAAAAAVLAVLLILLPLRKQMVALALAAGIVALPQVIYLSTGSGRAPSPALLHWGYTLDHPTIVNVIKYLGFTFGFKWLLIAIALVFATSLQRRVFVAISSLLLVAFVFQLSVEVLANHKFLHIWLIVANLFVAFGLCRLWRLSVGGTTVPGKIAAAVLTLLICLGGVIDLFPIHNSYWTEITYKNDRLIEWVTKETDARAIFLTDRFVNHPILMAGRRVFYGWPYYAWSAGYRAGDRDTTYRQMWQERNPQTLLKLLRDNNIAYVAIDDGVRQGEFGRNLNEAVYRSYFPTAFQQGSLVIFKVPQTITVAPGTEMPKPEAAPAVNMLAGGKGNGNGQFDWPRGIAVDDKGNVLVADTNNGRIQKFSPEGIFMSSFGHIGAGEGEFKEPGSIAIDRRGNIFVGDFLNRRVQKLKSDGTFIAQWPGPDEKFAPRDLAVGADNSVYVADEGGARIVKFDTNGKILSTFGSRGNGDGQFDQLTSVAVIDKANRVLVADPRNRRILVFDTNGKFIANWFVEEWRVIENAWYMQDLFVDAKADRLYATSTQTDEVLAFDLNGNKLMSLKPVPPDKLEGASSLALFKSRIYVVDTFASRISRIDLAASPASQPSPAK